MGNCGRCWLKQDLCLAEADGETEEREASANLLTTLWSRSLCAMTAQSSANSASRTVFFTVFVLAVSRRRTNRELSSQYRRYTPCSRSLLAWFSTYVKNRLKRTGASTHPCLTPLEMLKGSDASPSESTCPVMSSWNWRIRFMNLVGHISLDRITQRVSLLTVSKAFVRSMKTATRSMHFSCTWCTEKIMSVVLRFGRNPHWASCRFSSEMLVMRRLRMTRARIFPAMGRREMPR